MIELTTSWGKTMKFLQVLLIATVFLSALSGCSSTGGVAEEDTEGAAAAAGAGGPGGRKAGGPRINKYGQGGDAGPYGRGGRGAGYGADGYGGNGRGAGGGELDDPSSPLAKRVIYFQYDSYEVAPEYQSVVSSHANYLASHPEQDVVLEGHADERGSPEYNIALGEQRAKAVLRMMQLQGVGNGQVRIVSFGEEKPSDGGHDESSWQQNRRVEISYPGH
jgi:peptidoglycan-associated lipoprotein